MEQTIQQFKLSKVQTGILIVFVLALTFVAKQYFFDKPFLVTVNGEGKTYMKPTQMSLVATITNVGSGGRITMNDNLRMTQKIISSAKKLGAVQDKIIASYPKVSQTQLTDNNGPLYQAANSVSFTFNKVNEIDAIVGQLYADGAYDVSDITFTSENAKELEKEAVTKAIVDGQNRAEELAKSLHKSASKIVSITTSEQGQASAGVGNIKPGDSINSPPSEIEIDRTALIIYELR